MLHSGQCGHTPRIDAGVGGNCNYSLPHSTALRPKSATASSSDQQLLFGNGILVTYSQLVVKGQNFAVATIRSITVVERARKTLWAEMSFRAGLFVILVALLQALSGGIGLTLAGVLVGLILVATGLFSLLTAKPEYSVQITCSTGEVMEIYASQDKTFIEELIRAVNHILLTRLESATG
jgi:hypothetical protein